MDLKKKWKFILNEYQIKYWKMETINSIAKKGNYDRLSYEN